MECPHCHKTIDTLLVEAPATVVIAQRITAELPLDELTEQNVKRYDRTGRVLTSPRLEEWGEVLDRDLDHHSLELDATDNAGTSVVYAYCPECQGDVGEAFSAELEQRVPRMPVHKAEPTLNTEHFCRHCDEPIKRVPGGHGPTWVHEATGAVAGAGAPKPEPIASRRARA